MSYGPVTVYAEALNANVECSIQEESRISNSQSTFSTQHSPYVVRPSRNARSFRLREG